MFSVPQAVSDKKSNSLYTLLKMKTTKGCKTPGYLITVRKHKWDILRMEKLVQS